MSVASFYEELTHIMNGNVMSLDGDDEPAVPTEMILDEEVVGINWSKSEPQTNAPEMTTTTTTITLQNKRGTTVIKPKKSMKREPPRIVYGLSWSQAYLDREDTVGHRTEFRLLATCARRWVKVYRHVVTNTGDSPPTSTTNKSVHYRKPLPLAMTFDCRRKGEDLYSCVFVGHSATGAATEQLCAAGETGNIYVLDVVQKKLQKTMKGHGGEVFDLKVHPVNGNYLLSASMDQSCRFWNVQLGCTVAIFGGDDGHLAAVNSISWHHSGQFFCSGGSDVAISVWEMSDTVKAAMQASEQLCKDQETAHASSKRVKSHGALIGVGYEHFPIFSTTDLHFQPVDCVHFIGDLIISKSAAGDMCIWLPGIEENLTLNGKPFQPPPCDVTLLKSFSLIGNEFYFIHFAVDPSGRYLAAGSDKGRVSIWDITASDVDPATTVEVGGSHVIRNLAFSPDGALLVVSTDAGAIFRFDVKEEAETK